MPDHAQLIAVVEPEDQRADRVRLLPGSPADDHGIGVAGRAIAYADIDRARTVFNWGPQPKPGKQKKPKAVAR